MIKRVYNKFTLREQFLFVMLLFVCVLVWGNNLIDRGQELREAYKDLSDVEAYQALWLDSEGLIKERLAEALELYNPEKTYSRNEFIAKVDGFARESGGLYDITNPSTKADDIFNEHELTVKFRNASIGDLLKFEEGINGEAPYLEVKRVQITPVRRNPNMLLAQFDIVALELQEIRQRE